MHFATEAIAQAKARHAAGDWRGAEALYRRALETDSANAEVLYLLGEACHAQGKLSEAESSLEQAVRIKPDYPEAHNSLGAVLGRQGKLSRAAACVYRALELKPDFAEAYYNLATVAICRNRLDEAATCWRQAVQLKPDYAEAHANLGTVAMHQNHLDEAASRYRRAVELKPNLADAHNSLGIVLGRQGKLEEATACFRRAVELRPASAETLNNLGATLARQDKRDEAVICFRRAVDLKPDLADAHFSLGAVLAQQGKLDEAAACCRRAVQLRPQMAEAHSVLGTVALQQNNLVEADGCFRRAVELKPASAEAHYHLATALAHQGKLDEAAACCRRALELNADYVEAHNTLAAVLREQNKLDEAAACCRRALELNPRLADAHATLGAILAKQERFDEAIASYRRTLELKPGFPEVHNNLGGLLDQQGQFDEAAACFRRALDLKPDFAQAHNNLGTLLEKQGQLDEAAARFRRAVELKPDYANAHNNLSAVLVQQEKMDEAAACYRRALELKPDFAEASNNLGVLLIRQGRVAEAEACYQRALEFHPEQDIWKLNIISLCPSVFDDNVQIEHYRRNLLDELERFTARGASFDLASLAMSACRPSFNLQFHGGADRPIREAYGNLFRNCFPREVPTGSRSARPRIGVVVTDRHESIFLRSMGEVLERINPQRFELVVIGSQRGIGALRPAIRSSTIQLLPVANKFDQFVEAIRAARLDVLYYWEVGTDNTNYFLPFFRLAPVQCTSWGIQVTSGIPQLDYYLSSELVEPDDAAEHYTEQLVLARTLLTYQRRAALPASPKDREFFGIGQEKHLYLCAQQLGKFQPDFDPILAGILRADGHGVVVITEDRNGAFVAQQLRRRFAAAMPDVAERIVFLPFQSIPEEYLSLVAAADVLLDPLHFGGVNTTYDGFSLAKPIVTLPSRFHRGRYTLGCYKKMGLSECVASDAEHYVKIAVDLGTDADRRAEVADRIRRASPALFEDSQAVSEHERLFGMLVEEACSTRRRPSS